jgi:uncharacterized RDD family membrane protein YckC
MNTTNPYAPPRAAVKDVVDPDAGSEPAGRGTRLVASILDGIIIVVMIYTPMMIGVGISAAQAHGGKPQLHFSPIGGLFTLVGLVAWIWLTVMFVSRNGQSIAKKMMGIKVVRTDGSRASLGRIFWLRNFVNILLGLLPFYGVVDALLIFGESRQCVHDKIADTIVIKA